MEHKNVGKNIASLRKAKNLTQQELGQKLFVTDKAVSKWERGLSLPDISILEALAQTLDTDIYEILQIPKKQNLDLEKILQEEKSKLRKQMNQKLFLILIFFVLIASILLFKLIPFGYDVIHTRYLHNENKLINLGIPKFSFWMKNQENSYSYKNLRGKQILESEIKSYLNTLTKVSCNQTTYYYDDSTDTTVIEYNVTGNMLYNTITYHIRNGNYCDTLLLKEIKEKIGPLNTFRTLYSENSNLHIYFLPSVIMNETGYSLKATLNIYFNSNLLEQSEGTFEIQDQKLIYYRTNIQKQDLTIKIPNVSTFIIKEQKLILEENYLKEYEKGIILK